MRRKRLTLSTAMDSGFQPNKCMTARYVIQVFEMRGTLCTDTKQWAEDVINSPKCGLHGQYTILEHYFFNKIFNLCLVTMYMTV